MPVTRKRNRDRDGDKEEEDLREQRSQKVRASQRITCIFDSEDDDLFLSNLDRRMADLPSQTIDPVTSPEGPANHLMSPTQSQS